MFYGLLGNNLMTLNIGTNLLDSGAPFYETYETSDGGFLAVGAIEGRFYKEFIMGLGIDPSSLPHQYDMPKWPDMKERFAEVFRTKTRDEWMEIFEGKDACVAPILALNEVRNHPHNQERELLIELDGVPQPAPAPRLSRTPGQALEPGLPRGTHTREVLEQLGYDSEKVEVLFGKEVVE